MVLYFFIMTRIYSTNPSDNYATIWFVESHTETEVVDIVNNAKNAQKSWSQVTLAERVNMLREVYELFLSHKEKIAQSVAEEMGMPIRLARDEVQYGLNYFIWYLDNAEKYLTPEVTYENESEIHTVFYEPKWVIAAITPWNYPFMLFVWTEIFWDGKLWDFLTDQDIDGITFTWSTTVGKWLAKKAQEKGITAVMELGGSAPGIVCEDADIDSIVDTIYFMRFSNSGQMCDGLKRLIVHASRYDELVEKLSAKLVSKKIWNALDETVDIGPLVSESQLWAIQAQIHDAIDKWAKVLAKNTPDSIIWWAYMRAYIIWNISFDMKIWCEEVFWPILPIVCYNSIDEAIRLANNTPYGLWAYVFTQDKDNFHHIASSIQSGMVQMNNVNYCIPSDPFGGYKASGIGREHGKWGFYEFCNVKVISEPK